MKIQQAFKTFQGFTQQKGGYPKLESDRSMKICMVSDFFYPNTGGVESHLYCLSQRLIQRGHSVIIITHSYGQRKGIRYMTSGLKVYYLPYLVIHNQATFPIPFGYLPWFRQIFIREEIEIVHGHQAYSPMAQSAMLHARILGLHVCFTDHSLSGFADLGSILTNKLLKFALSDVDHVICVSHTSKENTVLRAALNPKNVSVIPNAVVASQFTPNPKAADPNWITIVVMSRLVYRKGIDLLAAVIPQICHDNPKVRFLVAGDGPKKIELEQMREKYMLQDRVELLGAVAHSKVRNVLNQGQIFLNTSLTEAFCIGIVEAACCGLLIVSTRVGGVPEVLPRHMILFGKPEEADLIETINRAIQISSSRQIDCFEFHREVKQMYSWMNVAERTENIYHDVLTKPVPPLIERLKRYYGCGLWAGKIFCTMVAISYLIFYFLEWFNPQSEIDRALPFDRKKYNELSRKDYDELNNE